LEIFNSLALLLGGSMASGMKMYLTAAVLGVSHRMHWLTLPGDTQILAHPLVIGVAIALYAVEFVADKIPYFDSVWDSIHTFIRPVGGAALGFLAMADTGPALQYSVGLVTGAIALDSHLTKATTRAAINTSPEPVSNSVASVTEDCCVVGVMYLIIKHPIITCIVVIAFIAFSIWFLIKMFRFLKRVFGKTDSIDSPKTKKQGQQGVQGQQTSRDSASL